MWPNGLKGLLVQAARLAGGDSLLADEGSRFQGGL